MSKKVCILLFLRNQKMNPQKQYFIKSGDMEYSPLRIDKTGRPCRFMLLNSPLAKKYTAYSLIQNDIKLIKGALLELENVNAGLITWQSLTFFIIITYGKCFVSNSGRGTYLIDDKVFKNAPVEILAEHHKMIDLRMGHVAHAGSDNERCYVTAYFYMLNEAFLEGIGWESRMASMASFVGDLTAISRLFDFLLKHVTQVISNIEKKLTSEIVADFSQKYNNAIKPDLMDLYTLEPVNDATGILTYDFKPAIFNRS